MRKPLSKGKPAAKDRHAGAGADAPSARALQPKKTQDSEEEPARYASPPCYLAEFSDVDFAEETEK